MDSSGGVNKKKLWEYTQCPGLREQVDAIKNDRKMSDQEKERKMMTLKADPKRCPLGFAHPPNGIEFGLGCGMCTEKDKKEIAEERAKKREALAKKVAKCGKNGLAEATYGLEGKKLDVTKELVKMIVGNKLRVDKGVYAKQVFTGGRDPIPSQTKWLIITAVVNGEVQKHRMKFDRHNRPVRSANPIFIDWSRHVKRGENLGTPDPEPVPMHANVKDQKGENFVFGMPANVKLYHGNARGYYFVAPCDFTIIGAKVLEHEYDRQWIQA